jgi:KUP system potassium uptake protein
MSQMRPGHAKAGMAALTFGALGVVFGDIGTSPLYALQTVFTHDNHAVPTTDSAVYGVVSLVFWTITIIVSVKYVTFIMRADNEGEGGIMALIALIRNVPAQRRVAGALLVALGIFGASLFYGDGMITPAISVLSAVEGLKVIDSGLKDLVIPITLAILTALFAIQRFGTHVVGRAFGPVMALWFAVIAVLGGSEVVQHPGILRALSPSYGAEFLFDHGGTAFIALGSVVLTITGAEALYADMGHFGRPPIRRAWFVLVFPALILQYMGQGALIIRDPSAVENPFFLLAPEWSRIPMVMLATAATVIASQAVISGAFSVTRQAVRLGFLPRLTIRHTSAREIGQVYVPAVNWLIFAAVVALVLGFRSSAHLASAYGVAVTGTLAIDTLLFFYVVRNLWRKPLWLSAIGCLSFLLIDLTFFTANLTKVLHGGWFPLTIALAVYVVLTTWQRGREIVTRNRVEEEGPLRAFVEELRDLDPSRAPGTGVFLNANPETTPLAMRAAVEHLNALPASVVIVSLQTTNAPHVPIEERLEIDDLGYRDDGILHITARHGFQDETHVPKIIHAAARRELECDIQLDRLSYFVSRITIVASDSPDMARWRKKLFLGIARNAGNPVEYFALPEEQTVVFGSLIPL